MSESTSNHFVEPEIFRTGDREVAPVSDFNRPEDVLEAMLQSIQGGELHARESLERAEDSPYRNFLEVGLALRRCLEDPSRRDYLTERLRPHAGLIMGTLPAGIQSHGLLPKGAAVYQQEFGLRRLEDVSDDEIRQWVIDDGGLIYGELKRYELENYFDYIARTVRAGGTMIDMGSGLGKVVMSAALSLPFDRCIGVEILGYRHRMANERLDKMLAIGAQGLAALPVPLQPSDVMLLPFRHIRTAEHLLNLRSRISFVEDDMFAFDVSQASLVFIYSTCFGSLMHLITDKLAREMPEHSLVSTTTFQIHHPAFKLVKHFPARTVAWTDVHFYERIPFDGPFPAPEPGVSHQPDTQAWEERVRQEFSQIDAKIAAEKGSA